MHPQFSPKQTSFDLHHITEELAMKGWEMPQLQQTTDGHPYMFDIDDAMWRATRFIPSEGVPQSITPETAQRMGALLGSLQSDLVAVRYIPVSRLPHFHDLGHQLRTLGEHYDNLPLGAQIEAKLVFADARSHSKSPFKAVPQLIHGDPRMENMLFRDGEPFTFVDWDTAMVDSPFLDIGDMLRSLMQFADDPGWDDFEKISRDIIDAYLDASTLENSPENHTLSFEAARDIALGLASRFLVDCDPDKPPYFQTGLTTDEERHGYLMKKAADNIVRSRFFNYMKGHAWNNQ